MRSSSIRSFLALALLPVAAGSLLAQMGDQRDAKGQVQAPPPKEWNIPPAPVLKPEEALKTFRLQPGFRIELVASEPLVEEPVAMDIDPDGRLWVVEMRSYMPDVDGKGEIEPINRIVVLEDTNKDGKMDKSTVYMDGLHLPRLVKVLKDGVLVAEPPYLWFTRDTNGDGKADEKVMVTDDYSVRETNPEGGGNAILWGMDNWLVSSSYGRRFRLKDGKWISSPVVSRGQWGQSMDDFGRTFTNSNSDYLRSDLVPLHYHARNPNLNLTNARQENRDSGVNHLVDANQELWPIRVTAGVNRGYWEGQLRKNGTLKEFTAACGPVIYRGDNFPAEFYGNYFSTEPSAHVVRRSILTEQDGIVTGRNAYAEQQQEFVGSTDERFRPVNLYTAPDGTLYVVDLYRGILQHRQFMTSYLRKQIIERGLDKGLRLGRIYRIVHESKPPGPAPSLSKATPTQLVEQLTNPNGWWRDTARRLLVERGDKAVAPALRKQALSPTASVPMRLQALWILEGLDSLDPEMLSNVMDDQAPKLRAAAVRLSEPMLKGGNRALVEKVAAKVRDSSREVRWQVAFSLGEAPAANRDAALAALLAADANTPFVVPAVISSLAGSEMSFLEQLAVSGDWRDSKPGFVTVFEWLAGSVLNEGNADHVERLFKLLNQDAQPKWQRMALLNGMKGTSVRKLPAFPSGLELAAKSSDAQVAKAAGDLFARFDWPNKHPGGPRPLTTAEKELFDHGSTVYTMVCAACHQANGQGLNGLALPLVNSKWVLGDERALARIVLKGKIGHFPTAMPSLEMMSDSDLASVLTFIRRNWGHEAAPVSPAVVGEMRRAVIIRGAPYTDAELEKIVAQKEN
jgi:glucose/arabinose dehydrogenase/mono/diheme cytochrome c family protein